MMMNAEESKLELMPTKDVPLYKRERLNRSQTIAKGQMMNIVEDVHNERNEEIT
jgi:hypothetical protein